MLKSQLEEKFQVFFKFESETSQKIVDTLIGYMSSAISNNDRIEIRGFGSFFKKNINLIPEEILKLEIKLVSQKKFCLYLDQVKNY